MQHRIFASKACDAQCEMLDDRTRCLSMHEITIGQRVLEHRHNRVAIVSRLRPDVFEYER
jgi:hypothetical protein